MTPEERVPALSEKDHDWLQSRFDKLQKAKQIFVKDDKISRPKPKIQRLPHYMQGRVEFETFYTPKLINTGPFSRTTKMGLRHEHKLMLTLMYLDETNVTISDLFFRIFDRIQDLRQLISDDVHTSNNVRLTWALLVDGCSVLQVLDKSKHPGGEQALRVGVDQLVRIHQDLLLLENQIPYLVLKILCNGDREAKLKECMHSFLAIHGFAIPSTEGKLDPGREVSPEHKVTVQDDDPVHLLDYLRRAILKNSADVDQVFNIDNKDKHKHKRNSLHLRKYRIGSIRELRAVGIRVKKHAINASFHPNFDAGQLLLPELTVDGSTALMFLNLIAYEMCPDFCNDFEISSFIVFLSSLIEQPEDVKELRSAGILRNELASDKEVADLFNKMDVILVPETARYAHIRDQIEDYIQSKRGKIKILGWMGEAYHTYFRSPWTVIALLAAAFGLALTFIQTWFAIHPKGS